MNFPPAFRVLSVLVVSDPLEYPRLRTLVELAWPEGKVEVQRLRASREALPYLDDQKTDVIVVSVTTGLQDALALLRQTRGAAEPVPVILVGAEDERFAVDAFRAGAADFVVRDALSSGRFRVALRRAIGLGERDRKLTRALRGRQADQWTGTGEAASEARTVMLVDDDDALRAITRRFLDAVGYSVLECESPGEAVELAWSHQGPIDLLITDALMPELNGQELAEHILALRPTIRVLFISNYSAEHLFRDTPMPARARFLRKPIHPGELRETVRAMLEEDSPNRAN